MEHLSAKQRLEVVIGLALQSFLVMFSYALCRPSTESLFLASEGSDKLPIAWLAVALGSILMVVIYNHILPKADLVKLFGEVCLLAALLFSALIPLCSYVPHHAYYLLYALKDLYVVALVEIFYTYTNTVLSIKKASWIYGFFGAVGSIGAFIGNLAVGKIAVAYTSEMALWLSVPLLLLMGVLGRIIAAIHGPAQKPLAKEEKSAAEANSKKGELPFISAWKVVNKSSYLWLMFFLIIVVQVAMTLIDYQYNHVIEATFANVDERTAVSGNIYAIASITTLLFNVLTGPIIGAIGVGSTMLIIPILLASGMVSFLAFPIFALIATVKITSKVMDYSLFKAAKNLLYIPLSYEEKTAGKSIVDMLTFRLAKGGAALILMALLFAEKNYATTFKVSSLVSPLTIALLIIWGVLVFFIVKRFNKLTKEK